MRVLAHCPDRWSERCRSSAEEGDRSRLGLRRRASLPLGGDGYPLRHGNRFPPSLRGDPGHRRSRREQDVPPARGAQAHAQGACVAPAPPHPLSDVQGAAQRLVRHRERRVLRDRRPQRERQEHAAQVPRRHLWGGRANLAPGTALDADRAGRRVQHGHGGPRQRRDERDHAGALSSGGP